MEQYADYIEEDECPEPDYYGEYAPSQEQIDHAKSLVGKWCISKGTSCTPLLSNLLCKVLSVNDASRGGNPAQVRMIPFRNKAMFAFHTWWLIPHTDIFEVVDSGWLIPTSERPRKTECVIAYVSMSLRILWGWLSKESMSFKYRWWNTKGLPFNYLPPINSLISAVYDLGRAFKYGVYINKWL
ncbi:hypothetical protein LCGC14_0543630 [marine sediment metagenome]|uniref:Uncharacterized protein n=1 Tax=marine sediment metagenome TaxID=412755 RepID=A0A0F9RWT6_9ZZZZ